MSRYFGVRRGSDIPRLPLEGELDLTYRCNNNCRHCWVSIPPEADEKAAELSLNEVKGIVDEARRMGCQSWHISGGEPLLRPDFAEIFDYVTGKCTAYYLNTNGTLITHDTARLMRRRGSKMISLYGATAGVHDHITRNPGSFEAVMRGISCLREAGAGFMVQLTLMQDNYHQLEDMINLAESLSLQWRFGASWFYLSASGDPERNQEIVRQRLDPAKLVELNNAGASRKQEKEKADVDINHHLKEDCRLLADCIARRNVFHIDPYGQMTFCAYIKDPALRYNLREGSFVEGWDKSIPSLADKVRGGKEYLENCGSCEIREDCYWCSVYSYLEHRRYSARIEYLCSIAREFAIRSCRFRQDEVYR